MIMKKNKIINNKAKGTKKVRNKAKNYVWKLKKIACLIIKLYMDNIFKSYYHNVHTEEVNKIALSSNDDKRLQPSDKIATYSYGTDKMMLINE